MTKKIFALVLALLLSLTAFAQGDGIVAEIGTRQIAAAELDAAYAATYGEDEGIDKELEFELKLEVLNLMLREEAERQMMAAQGFDSHTQAEIDEATEQAVLEYADNLAYYQGFFDDGTMTDDELIAATEAYLASVEMSQEDIVAQAVSNLGYDKLRAWALQGKELTDEDLYAYYEQMVEDDRAMYETFPDEFISCSVYGIPCLYVPEGMRAMRQIVVAFDYDQMEEYGFLADAQAQGVDVASDMDALYARLDDRVNEIMNQLGSGKSFVDVEMEYSDSWTFAEDLEDALYYVCEGSEIWDESFTQAAMAMTAVGEISQPVRTADGVVILYYAKDLPAGPVAYEEVQEYVADAASYMLETEVYEQALEQWIEELGAQIYLEEMQ